jgi:hypothetical protein
MPERNNGAAEPEERDQPLITPVPEELGGTSEHSAQVAGVNPSQRVKEARDPSRASPSRREDTTQEADDLGRHFLEDATQQVSPGERATREQDPEAAADEDPLVTHMPDRTEHEAQVSAEARRRIDEGETHREGPEETANPDEGGQR